MSELLEQMKLLNEDHKPDGWPAVRMSEINELIEIIEKKSEQLAKANERVAELEKERSNLSAKYKKNVSVIGAFVSELTGKVIILPKMRTKEEIEKSFNKFAIEQRQEAVEEYKKSDEFCKLLDSHFNSGKVYGHNEYYEQLRKEQE